MSMIAVPALPRSRRARFATPAVAPVAPAALPVADVSADTPLGTALRGFAGHVRRIDAARVTGGRLAPAELELRLIEMGFVEGAPVRILHQGLFGGDPIAVHVAGATVAVRRREAMAVHVI